MTAQVTNSQVQTLTESLQNHEPSPKTETDIIKLNTNCYGSGDRYCHTNTVSQTNQQNAQSKISNDDTNNNTLFDHTRITTFDKEMIYSHPLFPLLNTAFEKCATATCTPRQTSSLDVCSVTSFNDNILDFVKRIEVPQNISRDAGDSTDNSKQLDILLLQAIRVFRFHLLELDKVYELCDNFCHRYINCLKGKLPTELIADESNQTRTCPSTQSKDKPDDDFGRSASVDDFYSQHPAFPQNSSNRSPTVGTAFMNAGPSATNTYVNRNTCLQESIETRSNPFQNSYLPNDMLMNCSSKIDSRSKMGCSFYCGNGIDQQADGAQHQPSVYYVPQQQQQQQTQIQMEIQPARVGRRLSPEDSPAAKRVKYNHSPLNTSQKNRHNNNNIETEEHFRQDCSYSTGNQPDPSVRRRQKKRGIFPKVATNIMRSWLFANLNHPYPTEEQKKQLAHETGLTILQVNNWFINARRRIVQPMIDQTARAAQIPQNGMSQVPMPNGHMNSAHNIDYNDYLAAAVRYMPTNDHHSNLSQSMAQQHPSATSFNSNSSPATGFEVMAAAAAARAATYQQNPTILHPTPLVSSYCLDDNSLAQTLAMDDNYGAFRRFPQPHQQLQFGNPIHIPNMQLNSPPLTSQSIVTSSATASMAAAAAAAAAFYPPVMMSHAAAAAAAAHQYSTASSNGCYGSTTMMMPSNMKQSPQRPNMP